MLKVHNKVIRRSPDEVFLIEEKDKEYKIIKILEKKIKIVKVLYFFSKIFRRISISLGK